MDAEPSGPRRPRRLLLLLLLLVLLASAGTQASIIFTKEPSSQDALQGRRALLRCEVAGPGHLQVLWLLNGVPVVDTERRFAKGSSLSFAAVDRLQDAGSFQCVARDGETGEEVRSANASFNIKWIEAGPVVLKHPASLAEIQPQTPVTLRCHIDGHPRPTYQWFQDGNPLPDDPSNYSVSSKERNLTLRRAGPEHSGLYSCCAHNPFGHVCSSENVTLSIVDESFARPLVVPQDQVVGRNEEAMFHCQFGATPPPTLQWLFEDDSAITNRSRSPHLRRATVFANGSLLLTQVRPRNAGVYRCVGQGQRGPPVVLEAKLHLAEIEDMQPLEPQVFAAGREERVVCVAPRGLPEPSVWWERAGVRLPAHGSVYQEGRDLVFASTAEGDAGVYTCHAMNRAGQRHQELHVTVAMVPTWLQKPQDSQLEEGKPGYLHCLSRATPNPTITWYRNQMPISEDSRFEISANGTLRINNVEVYDGTWYRCVSSTQAGSIEAQARVQVLEKLKFTPPPQPQQCMEFDKEATVSCSATGREKPTIRWMKADGSSLPAWVTDNAGTLHFSKVTRGDAGNYTCIASNEPQGQIIANVHLTVAVFVTFKLEPEHTSVYQGHTALLQCQAQGDPIPLIQWKGKDRILDPALLEPRMQILSNGSLVIHNVAPEDSGRYTCIAGNSCNIKHVEASLYVVDKPVVEGPEGPGSPPPYKMIQTIGLSVGAAVAYIIAVLGLMFYCKKRCKAKRLQKQPEGEEPEMECLNGGPLQNGQPAAEIQEEVALTSLGSGSSAASKRQSASDKMTFSRSSLQHITTLGRPEAVPEDLQEQGGEAEAAAHQHQAEGGILHPGGLGHGAPLQQPLCAQRPGSPQLPGQRPATGEGVGPGAQQGRLQQVPSGRDGAREARPRETGGVGGGTPKVSRGSGTDLGVAYRVGVHLARPLPHRGGGFFPGEAGAASQPGHPRIGRREVGPGLGEEPQLPLSPVPGVPGIPGCRAAGEERDQGDARSIPRPASTTTYGNRGSRCAGCPRKPCWRVTSPPSRTSGPLVCSCGRCSRMARCPTGRWLMMRCWQVGISLPLSPSQVPFPRHPPQWGRATPTPPWSLSSRSLWAAGLDPGSEDGAEVP
uniref:Protein tyrosine kinase 7 (inactive) n=1 Tax=Ornithorhynchus anatinus TaxID=9258 RepID=A0A6I8ND46_ORNAN